MRLMPWSREAKVSMIFRSLLLLSVTFSYSLVFGPAISALGFNIGAVEVAATNHNPTGSGRTSRQSNQNYLSNAAPVGRRAVGMVQRCPANPLTGPQTSNPTMPGKYYSTFVLYISAYTHSNSAGPPTTESVETSENVPNAIHWQDQIPQASTSARPPFQPTERFPRLRKTMLERRLEQMDPEELQRIIKKACEEASGHW